MSGHVSHLLRRPVSAASLGFVRIGFGAVMLYEALWFLGWLPGGQRSPSRVEALFTGESVRWTFSYPGFEWATPLPEPWTTALFVTLAMASILLALGLLYRAAAVIVFTTFAYINLMDASIYLNHFYLACVIAMLLIFLPADRRFSVRAGTRRRDSDDGVPAWTVIVLRVQIFLVYFHAGVAKLNADWLIGEPLRRWLPHPATAGTLEPFVGEPATQAVRAWLSHDSTILAISYGGLVFDLAIGFLLLWRRTRLPAFVLAVLFHVANFVIFDIGAFPVMAIVLTTIFLEPDWPDRALRRIRCLKPGRADLGRMGPAAATPPSKLLHGQSATLHATSTTHPPYSTLVVACLGFWLLFQVGLPLRHFLIAGDISWTEEGHRFSWHMKLREKHPGPFHVEVYVPPAQSPELADSTTARYRQVDALRVPWESLPELVVVYEPLLGERLILNPAAGRSWQEAAAKARLRWRQTNGQAMDVRRTMSLQNVFATFKARLAAAQRNGEPQANAGLATLRELQALNRRVQDDRLDDAARLDGQFRFEEKLWELAAYPRWRRELLELLWHTPPFACQGAANEELPFMVVASREVLSPGNHSCSQIERTCCPSVGAVLIDLNRLSAKGWLGLPPTIHFEDFGGRPATFWNFADELHPGQVRAL